MITKINKSKQPELRKFNFSNSFFSGKYLFDLKINVGWPKFE